MLSSSAASIDCLTFNKKSGELVVRIRSISSCLNRIHSCFSPLAGEFLQFIFRKDVHRDNFESSDFKRRNYLASSEGALSIMEQRFYQIMYKVRV